VSKEDLRKAEAKWKRAQRRKKRMRTPQSARSN
jgi:hypothetical protein